MNDDGSAPKAMSRDAGRIAWSTWDARWKMNDDGGAPKAMSSRISRRRRTGGGHKHSGRGAI